MSSLKARNLPNGPRSLSPKSCLYVGFISRTCTLLILIYFQDSAAALPRGINALKLLRYNLPESEVTTELESARAAEYVQRYLEGLPFGQELPDTELQPADDLVILAGQAYVNLWKLTGSEDHLYAAVSILEYASIKSKQSYRIRLLLLRLYHLLGA